MDMAYDMEYVQKFLSMKRMLCAAAVGVLIYARNLYFIHRNNPNE